MTDLDLVSSMLTLCSVEFRAFDTGFNRTWLTVSGHIPQMIFQEGKLQNRGVMSDWAELQFGDWEVWEA